MTDKQKEAIKILNDLRLRGSVTDDEYFMFVDFVVNSEPQISYIPYSSNTTPLTYPQVIFETTCKP